MKTIYLRDDDYNWKSFSYAILSDLKSEFEKRNISIGNDARIGDLASIGYRASIGMGVKLMKSIYISGSFHSLTYDGVDKICIGCEHHTVDLWNANFEAIGKKNNYSDEQMEEYSDYIQVITLFNNLNKTKQNDNRYIK